jgi:hypothetical protein
MRTRARVSELGLSCGAILNCSGKWTQSHRKKRREVWGVPATPQNEENKDLLKNIDDEELKILRSKAFTFFYGKVVTIVTKLRVCIRK